MFIRPAIAAMDGYVPGFQPEDIDSWIKLNTNENPYPPSPLVVQAIQEELGEHGASLRTYPSASSQKLREVAASLYGVDPSWVIMANGSDEVLNNLIRATTGEGDEVGYLHPSYSYYATLAQIQGGAVRTFPVNEQLEVVDFPERYTGRIFFLTCPNSPLGYQMSLEQIEALARRCDGLLVVDEAYADFSDQTAIQLIHRYPNMVVTRTLSKSYALAGMRLGLAIAHPPVIQALDKIRDHYNLDRLAQAACVAALSDQQYFKDRRDAVVATRERVREQLTAVGYSVLPSSGNFLFVIPPDNNGKRLYQGLYDARILVRHFSDPLLSQGVRISIGTEQEMEATVAVMTGLVLG